MLPLLPVILWFFQAEALIGASSEPSERVGRRFPEVVQLRSRTEVCTGTIVGPRVVLSAAHCADLKSAYFVYQDQRYEVKFTTSGDYTAKEHDVAVALTTREIKGAHPIAIGSGMKHGSRLTLAGFGCTVKGGATGRLHMGDTRVIGMDNDHVLSSSKDGSVLCAGDSGGPAFLAEGTTHTLVAVNMAGDIQNVNLNVRLDSQLSQSFLRKVADRFRVAICGITMRCKPPSHQIAALK